MCLLRGLLGHCALGHRALGRFGAFSQQTVNMRICGSDFITVSRLCAVSATPRWGGAASCISPPSACRPLNRAASSAGASPGPTRRRCWGRWWLSACSQYTVPMSPTVILCRHICAVNGVGYVWVATFRLSQRRCGHVCRVSARSIPRVGVCRLSLCTVLARSEFCGMEGIRQ